MAGETGLHIGFGNTVAASRVVSILMPDTAPAKRLRDRADSEGRLLDAGKNRRTRALIVTDSNHVILSAMTPETLWGRMGKAQEEVEL